VGLAEVLHEDGFARRADVRVDQPAVLVDRPLMVAEVTPGVGSQAVPASVIR